MRSETDFVARNDLFQEKARALARLALGMGEGVDDAALLAGTDGRQTRQ